MKDIQYSIIVPLFNEELVVLESYKRLKAVMDGVGESYELLFVNDGSRDKTREIMTEICEKDKNSKLINFSRNFGHQIAISAGMDHARGAAVVVIDADLQDPPGVIPKLIEKWKEGFEVVYGKRSKRKGESFFKKLTATLFYRFLRAMTNVDIPLDVGDFRLIDRRVCDTMKKIREQNRFVRGLVSWVGFKQGEVVYVREERWAGVTKYPLKKMLRFAADGIASFSWKPLKLATGLGLFLILASLVLLACALVLGITGLWLIASLILFSNGMTLMVMGIIGEYIGRIYDESKNRPLYIIQSAIGLDKEYSE